MWQLAEAGVLSGVVLETDLLQPPFDTHHPFEDERDAFERDVLLAGCPEAIDGFAPTLRTATVNEREAERALTEWDPGLVVSFGTGLIRPPLVERWRGRLLNLHGGDPEEYRGLDTHLWAIYHRDFDALVTVLHEVEPELDTGALAGRAALGLERGMPLAQLRALNTRACLDLTLAAARGAGERQPQTRRGRYYSFMPAILKDVCVRNFERHTASL